MIMTVVFACICRFLRARHVANPATRRRGCVFPSAYPARVTQSPQRYAASPADDLSVRPQLGRRVAPSTAQPEACRTDLPPDNDDAGSRRHRFALDAIRVGPPVIIQECSARAALSQRKPSCSWVRRIRRLEGRFTSHHGLAATLSVAERPVETRQA